MIPVWPIGGSRGVGALSSRVTLALSLCSLANAGPGVWDSGGPYGGTVSVLAIEPGKPATLYAATFGGVFKSTDAAATWTDASTGLPSYVSLLALAIDPKNSAIVYAGTYDGLYKSADAARTWTDASNGLTDRHVRALAIDPTHPATLYAGTYGGVFKSTNASATWTASSAGLTTLDVRALAIDPQDPATLYAGTYDGGVFKSTDAGAHWVHASNGLYRYILGLAIDPLNPRTLYAGTYYGVYRSGDAGGTWTAAVGVEGLIVESLAVDPVAHETVYAATHDGVFKSTDSGRTWAVASAGVTHLSVVALAVDPAVPARVYCGTNGGGVFKTANRGQTWTAASRGLTRVQVRALAVDRVTSTVYAGTDDGGVFKSTDSGQHWLAANSGLPRFLPEIAGLAVDPASPATLFAGGREGIWKSVDGGSAWTDSSTGLTYPFVRALAVDGVAPGAIYAGTYGGGVFKSTDSGAHWASCSVGLTTPYIEALAVDPSNPAVLYAGTDSGVFKSADSGASWYAANDGLTLPWLYVHALAVDPGMPATIYAGTDLGVFRSTDGAGNWAPASGGLEYLNVYALAADPVRPGTVYAGAGFGGVFESNDSGETWHAANPGLTGRNVWALSLDSSAETTVYAGTDAAVWQKTNPEAELALVLSDALDPVVGTTPLIYSLKIANAGPDPATSVSVTHHLPVGAVFDSASGAGWACSHSASVVTCNRPVLAVGSAPDIAVQVTPGPAAALLSSSASVSAPATDPNDANNADTEETTVSPALVWMGTRTMTALADSGQFLVNGGATYTITLTNSGPSTQGDNAGHELVDTLPSSLVLVSATASSGEADADLAANTVTWDGTLASGGSVAITIQATVGPRVALGVTVSNQATVFYDADGNGTNEAAVVTDDPGASGPNDPTSFLVVSPTMGFYTLAPCRLLDTRDAAGTYGGPALVAAADRVFPLWGRCDIPPTARALSANITVTQSTSPGNLRLYPAATPLPLVSSINYLAGQTRANNAAVALNGLGELAVRCSQASGTAHMVLDVNGYFAEGDR